MAEVGGKILQEIKTSSFNHRVDTEMHPSRFLPSTILTSTEDIEGNQPRGTNCPPFLQPGPGKRCWHC